MNPKRKWFVLTLLLDYNHGLFKKQIGSFEKYLTIWVALCIVGGILIDSFTGESMEILCFGLQSPAALVAVVGVLVEVPVMLSLVALANKWKY